MPKSEATDTKAAEALLARHTPEVRALVERLRRLVRQTAPEATEAMQPRWHSLNYRHPSPGSLCGIFPFTDDVKPDFEFGVLLPDPAGLLPGDGKQARLYMADSRARAGGRR